MSKIKISKSTVDSLVPSDSGQITCWDSAIPGFGVRIGSKSKTYIVMKKVCGKAIRVTLGTHGQITAEQARKMAVEVLGKMATGINPTDEKRQARVQSATLEEAYEAYLEARDLKPRTRRDLDYIMKTYLADWRQKPLSSITRDMVLGRHKEIVENRGGPAQANLCMRCLRAIINFAQAKYRTASGRKLIDENPVLVLSETRSWQRVTRRQSVIKGHELPALFDALDKLENAQSEGDSRGRDYVLFLLFSGMRRTEAAKLQWDSVDFKDKTITVTDTKNRNPLLLPLSEPLFDLLSKRYEKRTGTYIFPAESSTGYLMDIKRQLAKIRKESGLNFSLHDLRRTFITVAESLDISSYSLKKLVNHSAGNDVTAGYIISDVERLRAPMQAIADKILVSAGRRGQADVIPINRQKQA